jgi:hypothetical protein
MGLVEDHRTLAEFYPDPERRHQVHYAWAHQFLPAYIHDAPLAFFNGCRAPSADPERFVQARFPMFESIAGLRPMPDAADDGTTTFRRLADLTARALDLNKSRAVLIVMPPGDRCPQAIFALAVESSPKRFLRSSGGPRYFTLERDVEDDAPDAQTPAPPPSRGVLGEWTADHSHRNYGGVAPADTATFIEAVRRLL